MNRYATTPNPHVDNKPLPRVNIYRSTHGQRLLNYLTDRSFLEARNLFGDRLHFPEPTEPLHRYIEDLITPEQPKRGLIGW